MASLQPIHFTLRPAPESEPIRSLAYPFAVRESQIIGIEGPDYVKILRDEMDRIENEVLKNPDETPLIRDRLREDIAMKREAAEKFETLIKAVKSTNESIKMLGHRLSDREPRESRFTDLMLAARRQAERDDPRIPHVRRQNTRAVAEHRINMMLSEKMAEAGKEINRMLDEEEQEIPEKIRALKEKLTEAEAILKEFRHPETPFLDSVRRKIGGKLNRVRDQGDEMIELSARRVGSAAGKKISNKLFDRIGRRRARQQKELEGKFYQLPDGQWRSLFDGKSRSDQRRATLLYKQLLALDEISRERGLEPLFLTITAPPRFHPNPKIGKGSWDKSPPKQAAEWIQVNWNTILTRLRQVEAAQAGIKVMEMHDDECPHAHILMYSPTGKRAEAERIVSDRDCWESPHAIEMRWLDDKKDGAASPASYVMKYVLSELNSSSSQNDDDATRNGMALKLWSIRSHSTFGVPSLDVFNFLKAQGDKDYDESQLVADLRKAVLDDNMKKYIELMGGPGGKVPVRVEKIGKTQRLVSVSNQRILEELVKKSMEIVRREQFSSSDFDLSLITQGNPKRGEADFVFSESDLGDAEYWGKSPPSTYSPPATT